MSRTRNGTGPTNNPPRPSVSDLLTARPTGLVECESWAVLCQAVQALQDLFLADGASNKACIPLVTPSTLMLSSKGRVKLCPSRVVPSGRTAPHLAGYLAPEYRPNKQFTDTEMEKMWIHALGETLKRATLTSHVATSRLSRELCQVLTDMTRPQASSRASLMHLLDVISEYCTKRQQNRPFSHIVMDLHQEAMAALEVAFDTPWMGPPAMPELRPIARIRSDLTSTSYGPIPRRWLGLIRNVSHTLPRLTREASTSMEDVGFDENFSNSPGRAVRPKSMCVPDRGYYERIDDLEPFYFADRRQFSDSNVRKCDSDFLGNRIVEDCHGRGLKEDKSNDNVFNNRRLNPVQRVASRLRRMGSEPKVAHKSGNAARERVGPEFVHRSSQPSRQLIMADLKGSGRKSVTVVMLNGQKLDVICNPSSTTAGQLFELIIQKEHIEENFMLGLFALIAGDFVYLPSDTRIGKVVCPDDGPTLYARVRFFLPSLRGLRGGWARHLLYLQLRRSILEHQLPCSFRQIIELDGLALQAEFGDFDEGNANRNYFLIEHYIPETMSVVIEDSERLRKELVKNHMSKRGLDTEKAEEDFIKYAQTLPHYGGHFYTATWILKNNDPKDVWLYISAKGMNLYERGQQTSNVGPQLYEAFEWRNIQTLCYSKQYLCILPHKNFDSVSKLKKYKLKMDQKKSYFTFRLASLHHQFFLRLRTEYISPQSLSQQFGIPLKDIKNEANALYKLESLANPIYLSSSLPETEFKIDFRTGSSSRSSTAPSGGGSVKRSKSVHDFKDPNGSIDEEFQNKENENPCRKSGSFNAGLVLESKYLSGLPAEKRRGVKMGTRAFSNVKCGVSRSIEAMSGVNNDYLEEMSLTSVELPWSSSSVSRTATGGSTPNEAYILDSTVKATPQPFLPDFQETLSESLAEKLNNLSFAEERVLSSLTIDRDRAGSLGLRITEGSDGNVYVEAVIEGSPAFCRGNVRRGDQIVAVDGVSLLGMRYELALEVLKSTGGTVELVVARPMSKPSPSSASPVEKHLTESCADACNVRKRQAEVPYHKRIRYEIEAPESLLRRRSFGRSCGELDKARVVGLIPKTDVEAGRFRSLDRQPARLVEGVAVPRCLGLSRKWKGPVRYPVTPVKKSEEGSCTSTSDEEQVFI